MFYHSIISTHDVDTNQTDCKYFINTVQNFADSKVIVALMQSKHRVYWTLIQQNVYFQLEISQTVYWERLKQCFVSTLAVRHHAA